jgi:hypothetical protein
MYIIERSREAEEKDKLLPSQIEKSGASQSSLDTTTNAEMIYGLNMALRWTCSRRVAFFVHFFGGS